MILLQANDVARRFADVTLYENVSFNIQTNDRIALVGRNGAGKSTLISQIMKTEPISAGEITRSRDLRVGYLEQHVSIDSDRSIWEEMLHVFSDTLALREKAEVAAERVAELSEDWESKEYQNALSAYDQIQQQLAESNAYGVESEIRTVLHGFQFYEEDYDRPVQSLSGGQKTRLALARILLMSYDLLILDEPTNHLDMQTLNWLEGYLRGYRGALLIVSHDRYFLNRVANQVIELRNNTLHTYKGNYDFYLKEKALRMEQEWKEYQKQQIEIEKLEDFVAKNIVRASTTKRAQSRRKKLEKMDRIEKPKQDAKAPRIEFSASRDSGNRVIETRDLTIGYEEPIAKTINMDLRRQDAIAIVGPNGVGKTTFLKTILQQIPALSGEVIFGSNVDIGYYDQNVNQLDGNLTVLETLWQAHDTTDEWKVRSILGSFLFSGETVEKKVSMLSGGEKARLSLALLATDHDNTLLLDEPTNHLDIDSKEVLEEALIDYDGTLLFVSHDRYFINRTATNILEISPEGASLYLGDYDYYIEKKRELEEIEALREQDSQVEPTPTKEMSQNQFTYEETKALKKDLRKLQTKVDEAMAESEAMDALITKLEADMITANEANDQPELADLNKKLIQANERQTNALETWEEASIELEAFMEEHPGIEI
ncbi:ATP-binding cassette domain-containing protein [Aerococcaceae bacterium INB8]|uniref:ATP-binding cassette domain-containing protein n=1 Tax=Ruoffia halotolerans TaxID=2748684 RepID=A0A839A5U3_9LACT|nr:ABC-F family ATP-binding cassette domain-containing protein [Ruoffia halotolerans]MBA5729190.1 ATP-binding cassette domain-containing protein [Ruoffia halotolerans]